MVSIEIESKQGDINIIINTNQNKKSNWFLCWYNKVRSLYNKFCEFEMEKI